MSKPSGIRALLLRQHISSFLLSLFVFGGFIILVTFDMEDQALERQMTTATERLISKSENLNTSGNLHAMPLEYFVGREALPDWLSAQIKPHWTNDFYEVTAPSGEHLHLNIRPLSNGQTLFVVFNAGQILSAEENIALYIKIVALFAFILLAVSLIFVRRMGARISKPLERVANDLARSSKPGTTIPDTNIQELDTLVHAIAERDAKIIELIAREHQFNRDVSHELRTPLTIATGAIDLIAETGESSKAFTRLQNSVHDMTMLTEGILWLAREPVKTSTSPDTLVSYCKETFEAIANERGLEFNTIKADDAGPIPAPESVTRVIVSNLVRNALHYTHEGSVEIAFKVKELCIADTGIGFGKADPSEEGFGIGLSIVRRLCGHYDLSLNIQSKPDGGTHISITWD